MDKNIQVYQLCPHSGYLMQSYLIKTPNDKIIMIDGGHDYYMEKAYLPHAIRAILGLNDGDYFEIDAWFLSHGHIDHFGEFAMMMKEYNQNSNYKVKNFYFDFPDFEKTNFEEADYSLEKLQLLKDGFETYAKVNGISVVGSYYDYLNSSVINKQSVDSGLSFIIDGVKLDILQTQDESDDHVNSNSLVIRVQDCNKKSKTCLFLNDASETSGARLLSKYGKALKSDIVQMAHHGQAGVCKNVYDVIDATVRLWPTPFWLWQDHERWRIDEVRSWFNLKEDKYTENDILACRYGDYLEDYTSISDWKKCLGKMKITL